MLVLVAVCVPALARIHSDVRAEESGQLYEGGAFVLSVDILVDTWLTAAPNLGDWLLPEARVEFLGTVGHGISRQVDGQHYFGVTVQYLITPLAPGILAIPGIPFSVTVGPESTSMEAYTAPLDLFVQPLPDEASVTDTIVGANVALSQRLTNDPLVFHVDDVVTRELILTGAALDPSLIAGLLVPTEVAGASEQVLEPTTSRRVDDRKRTLTTEYRWRVEYQLQKKGRVALPEIRMRRFDPRTGEFATLTVPSITLKVEESTRSADSWSTSRLSPPGTVNSQHFQRVLAVVGVGTLVVLFARRLPLRRLTRMLSERVSRIATSEHYAWIKALSPFASYAARLFWCYRAVRRRSGSYRLSAPERADSSQIGSAGETIQMHFRKPTTNPTTNPRLPCSQILHLRRSHCSGTEQRRK